MDNPAVKTAPANPAYDLTECKAQLRVAHSDDDTLITQLCDTAEKYIEDYLSRSLITTTWLWYLDSFGPSARGESDDYWYSPMPTGERCPAVLNIPVLPFASIVAFTYTDPAGNSDTLTSSDYEIDTINGRIMPSASQGNWPQVSTSVFNPIVIEFTAGYGADDSAVPLRIKQALYMLVAYWYENRENAGPQLFRTIPDGFTDLLTEYKKRAF